MRLELWRDILDKCTLGNIYIDGVWQSYSLEPLKPIPAGDYELTMEFWERHHDFYPLLHDVPGHTGIFIHGGYNVATTTNCIVVGLRKGYDYVLDSQIALTQLKNRIAEGLELATVTLKIINPIVASNEEVVL